MRGFGSRVHMHPLFQIQFKHIMNCQKKMLNELLHNLYVNQVVSRKTNLRGLGKKTKLGVKIRVYTWHVFVFFTQDTKNIGLPRHFVVHTKNIKMYAWNFSSDFFQILKNVF
jgi:hypothetical protein